MSGHSKWSTIKRQKAATDAKRGAIFTKLGNLITIAVREKGSDPDANFSLRIAIEKAKAANMPKENIERAVKRGTGEWSGGAIEELLYEGFGPAKAQFIIKSLTDNKNRTAANIRHLFTKYGGSLGTVMWNFEQKGVIRIETRIIDEFLPKADQPWAEDANWDELELELIDAGAQDIIREAEGLTIYTKIEDLQKVKGFLDDKNITTESAAIEYIAKEELDLDDGNKEKVNKFIEELEDCEDVADYYTNVSI